VSLTLSNDDLSALFGIDIDVGHDPQPDLSVAKVVCPKCNGRGNFIGYTGRIVGKCFACSGTGIEASLIAEPVKEGDCPKCRGTGEWRDGRKCFACSGTGKEKQSATCDVSAIATAFQSARDNGIKSPKLRLDTFVFSRAPDTGRNAGSIYVKDNGEYIGKVTDGKFLPTFQCDDATRDRVVSVASDPHKAAKAYGMKTGSCSCCGRELTNKESIELGIGPICLENYGW
jgi:hypothetical protein